MSGNGWVTNKATGSYNATDFYVCEDIGVDYGHDCESLTKSDCCYGLYAPESNFSGYCDKSCGFCFVNDDDYCWGWDDDDDDDPHAMMRLIMTGVGSAAAALLVGVCALGTYRCIVNRKGPEPKEEAGVEAKDIGNPAVTAAAVVVGEA